jgi:uncharacterized membrane protein YgcG
LRWTATFRTRLASAIADEAGMLSAGDRTALTASLADLEAKTTDQLVVVTLKSLQVKTIEGYDFTGTKCIPGRSASSQIASASLLTFCHV